MGVFVPKRGFQTIQTAYQIEKVIYYDIYNVCGLYNDLYRYVWSILDDIGGDLSCFGDLPSGNTRQETYLVGRDIGFSDPDISRLTQWYILISIL